MGGGSSVNYKIIDGSANASTVGKSEWLADSSTRLLPINAESFQVKKATGKGKFGLVFLSCHSNTGKHVAIKFIPKDIITETQSAIRIQQELDILNKVNHPFVTYCFGSYDTTACIAVVLEYCLGGELYNIMKKNHKLTEEVSKFYFCEISLALNYLHKKLNIVYRDLKPENILLDCAGHIKLCDFGFAVTLGDDKPALQDGCGTAMYVAPEIASGFNQNHGHPVDWWGLGCVLVEMLTGEAPFGDTEKMSKFEIFNNINGNAPRLGMSMKSSIKTLAKGLLDKDQTKRFSFENVRKCEWLADFPWKGLEAKQIQPPFPPSDTKLEGSTSNFLNWDGLVLPTKTDNPNSTAYCRSIAVGVKNGSGGGNGAVAFPSRPSISKSNSIKASPLIPRKGSLK